MKKTNSILIAAATAFFAVGPTFAQRGEHQENRRPRKANALEQFDQRLKRMEAVIQRLGKQLQTIVKKAHSPKQNFKQPGQSPAYKVFKKAAPQVTPKKGFTFKGRGTTPRQLFMSKVKQPGQSPAYKVFKKAAPQATPKKGFTFKGRGTTPRQLYMTQITQSNDPVAKKMALALKKRSSAYAKKAEAGKRKTEIMARIKAFHQRQMGRRPQQPGGHGKAKPSTGQRSRIQAFMRKRIGQARTHHQRASRPQHGQARRSAQRFSRERIIHFLRQNPQLARALKKFFTTEQRSAPQKGRMMKSRRMMPSGKQSMKRERRPGRMHM